MDDDIGDIPESSEQRAPLGYQPHAGQLAIHRDRDFRFRTICCGRCWGKTRFAAAELIDIAGSEGGLFAWIAPTYFLCERGQKAIQTIAGPMVTFKGVNPVRATFDGAAGRAEILFLSADNPDTILGDGYDGVVVDEAARIPRDVWELNIRPALADKQGWALLISTPRARNWFFDLHTRGRDPSETLYRSYTFPSDSNPYFSTEEFEEARRTTPQDIFRQEYLAEFLEDSAGVFRSLDRCLLHETPKRTGDVVIGCDLAKHSDFTVLIAMDRSTGYCLEIERFNLLDWPVQKDRVEAFVRKYNGLLILDATGIGDPIFDDLRPRIPRMQGIKLTNTSKAGLIQRLVVNIEQGRVGWPSSWTVLTDELKRYEYKITANGSITYNAPGGFHDDCVMAFALANDGRHPENSISRPAIPMQRPIPRRRQLIRPMRG